LADRGLKKIESASSIVRMILKRRLRSATASSTLPQDPLFGHLPLAAGGTLPSAALRGAVRDRRSRKGCPPARELTGSKRFQNGSYEQHYSTNIVLSMHALFSVLQAAQRSVVTSRTQEKKANSAPPNSHTGKAAKVARGQFYTGNCSAANTCVSSASNPKNVSTVYYWSVEQSSDVTNGHQQSPVVIFSERDLTPQKPAL
jgi:hypothetical protein